jgi:hypothetical protein
LNRRGDILRVNSSSCSGVNEEFDISVVVITCSFRVKDKLLLPI